MSVGLATRVLSADNSAAQERRVVTESHSERTCTARRFPSLDSPRRSPTPRARKQHNAAKEEEEEDEVPTISRTREAKDGDPLSPWLLVFFFSLARGSRKRVGDIDEISCRRTNGQCRFAQIRQRGRRFSARTASRTDRFPALTIDRSIAVRSNGGAAQWIPIIISLKYCL